MACNLTGNTIGPLFFILPARYPIPPSNEPTMLVHAIDVLLVMCILAAGTLFFPPCLARFCAVSCAICISSR